MGGWIGSGEEDDGEKDRVYECELDYGPSQGTGRSEYVLRGYLNIIAATVNNAYTYLKYDTEYEHNEYTVQKIKLRAEARMQPGDPGEEVGIDPLDTETHQGRGDDGGYCRNGMRALPADT